jgi:hypothetical protein
MANCGLCGRPIYGSADPICDFCKRASARHKNKNAERANRKFEEQAEMLSNIVNPGQDEDVRTDMRRDHYVDTHDAASVWVDENPKGKKKRR